MKAASVFVLCLILGWHLSAGVSAFALNEDQKNRAQQLLTRSEEQNLSDHELAIQTAQEALALFQSINDQEGVANTYLDLGRYYYAGSEL